MFNHVFPVCLVYSVCPVCSFCPVYPPCPAWSAACGISLQRWLLIVSPHDLLEKSQWSYLQASRGLSDLIKPLTCLCMEARGLMLLNMRELPCQSLWITELLSPKGRYRAARTAKKVEQNYDKGKSFISIILEREQIRVRVRERWAPARPLRHNNTRGINQLVARNPPEIKKS